MIQRPLVDGGNGAPQSSEQVSDQLPQLELILANPTRLIRDIASHGLSR